MLADSSVMAIFHDEVDVAPSAAGTVFSFATASDSSAATTSTSSMSDSAPLPSEPVPTPLTDAERVPFAVPLPVPVAEWLSDQEHMSWRGLDRDATRERLIAAQRADPTLQQHFAEVQEEKAEGSFILENGLLLRCVTFKDLNGYDGLQRVLVIPQQLRTVLLATVHDDPLTGGHLGLTKAYDKLKVRYWWPRMWKDTENHLKACQTCQGFKGRPGKAPIAAIELPGLPFKLMGLDTIYLVPQDGQG